ncbi:MAG: hypothetical protein P1U56_13895 [Saprospiraceae bacterium]|nr:hypothetical protein [Saprospiraceae bacterium]
MKNNFGLNQQEFEDYVEKTKKGDESFFVLLSQVHFGPCIAFLQAKFKITYGTAYDVCMDTMLKFRTKILKDKIKYGNLNYLYTRMASNIYLDSKKHKNRLEDAMSYFTSDDEYKKNEDDFLDVLDIAMERLDEENRTLLKAIYFEENDLHKMAETRNISYPTLRKRKQRMLEKLKSIFKEQLLKTNYRF